MENNTTQDETTGQRPVVAVLDIGKTFLKVSLATRDGRVFAARQAENRIVRDGDWRRHDLAAAEDFILSSLKEFGAEHRIEDVVACGHGSAGVLVGPQDLDRPEPRLPMLDYEQPVPEPVAASYLEATGDFFDRGSTVMHAATHQARQMLWVETAAPEAFAEAEYHLGVPQFWAWRLSGIAAGEISHLAAQSDLWNTREGRPSRIVRERGWTRLLPPIRPAFEALGPLRPALAERTGLLQSVRVRVGLHDSSANFYRYQAAGHRRMTVVSTGTWIVALSDHADLSALDPARGMTLNADVMGRPLGGALTMAGREFAAIAGDAVGQANASAAALERLVDRQTFALPSFGKGDGLFPGSAGRGRIEGREPETAEERMTLAVLTAALLASECLVLLQNQGSILLDGAFLKDPLFARIVAALNPEVETRYNPAADGVAAGAALLPSEGEPDRVVALDLRAPEPLLVEGLAAYCDRWRALAADLSTG
ncbi:FGGY family carbohydrate kinase [Jiella pelagia]|uniref:FGGY family carbohydrate kinase n=1 Tax=Jiella pelagia TaxID=2986949 RepID=A0ABY7C2A9_9HYPH|nr:FGGY family carbohydrate kinase [Jiella pelagia]WAP69169.1 FGGY family carbohydrate kinase [Jiella pelagia]